MANAFGANQSAYRFQEDDGAQGTATLLGSENTALSRNVAADSNIQLRIQVDEVGGGNIASTTNASWQLQRSIAGGAFANVTTTSTGVKVNTGSALTDNAPTSARLTSPGATFGNGSCDDQNGIVVYTHSGNTYAEHVFGLTLVAADLADGNAVTFRLLYDGALFTTTQNGAYTVTPTITVEGPIDPVITSIDTDNDTVDTRTDVVIAGLNFGASETGSAKVEVSNNATYGSGTVVEIDVTSWSDTSISVTLRQESNSAALATLFTLPLSPAYLWVTASNGARNAVGFQFTLQPPGPTIFAAVNTNAVLDVDATYLLRVRVENTGGVGATDFRWSYNHNSAGFLPVTTSSTAIKAVAASSFVNDADVFEVLGGSGTYLSDNNAGTEDGTTTLGAAFPASGAVEFVLAFQIVALDVTDAQTGQIRLELGDGTDLDAYTNTLTYTVEVGGISGDGAGALAASTGDAAGELELSGTASGSLASVTGAATGALDIAGSAVGSLAATTGDADGALTIAGSAAGTLAAATGVATGSFPGEVTGTGAGTLAIATGTAAGDLDIGGTAAGALAAVVGSATGSFELGAVTGTAAGVLTAATGSGTGTLNIDGAAAGLLVAASGSATGIAEVVGVASSNLAAATGSASGQATAVPTPVAAINTNANLVVDTTYLVWVRVENTGTEGAAAFEWQYNHESAGWVAITTSSSNVRAVAADSFADNDDVPETLGGSGTYLSDNDAASEDGTTTLPANFPASGAVEFVLSFQLRGVDVSDAETGQIRLGLPSVVAFDSYTNILTYTVGVSATGTADGTLAAATGDADGNVAVPETTGTGAGALVAGTGDGDSWWIPSGQDFWSDLTPFSDITGWLATGSASGTGSATLAATTGAASGLVEVVGVGAGILGISDATASGELSIDASASGTLAAITGEASGTFLAGVSGTGAGTLAAAAGSAAGFVEATGTGDGALQAAIGDAVAELSIEGTASGQLVAATATAAGWAEVTGTGDGLLTVVSGQAAAFFTLDGTAVGTLQAAEGSAAGVVEATGTGDGTLAAVTGDAAGEYAHVGAGVGSLAASSGAASGLVEATGTGVGTLEFVEGSAAGELAILGTAAGTLAATSGLASGNVVEGIGGVAAGALVAATASAAGDVEIRGPVAGILAAATGDAVGEQVLEGTAAGTLAAASGAATGNAPIYMRMPTVAIVAGGGNLRDTLTNSPPTRLADIDEDVTADDGEWWTADDPQVVTDVRLRFATPTSTLTGNQVLRARLRKAA